MKAVIAATLAVLVLTAEAKLKDKECEGKSIALNLPVYSTN